MEIVYCDKCGIRLSAEELEQCKAAAGSGAALLCPKCAPVPVVASRDQRRQSSHAVLPSASSKGPKSNKALTPVVRSNKSDRFEAAPAARRITARLRGDSQRPLGMAVTVFGAVAVLLLICGVFVAAGRGHPGSGDDQSRKQTSAAGSGGVDGERQTGRVPIDTPHVPAEPARTPAQPTQPEQPAPTNAAPSMALTMLSAPASPDEARASRDYATLFDGIATGDAPARIKKLEQFLARVPADWDIAPRARVELENLKKGTASPAVADVYNAPVEKAVLIGHWKLDDQVPGTAADSSGNNLAAKWVNGPVRKEHGMYFNGNGSFIEIPNSPELDHLQEDDFSICAWFKPDGDPAVESDHLHCGYGIVMKPGRHTGLSYYHGGYFGMDAWSAKAERLIAVAPAAPPDSYHHLCGVVRRRGGETRIYVDGKMSRSKFWDPNLALLDYGSEKWRIGCAVPGDGEWAWPAKGIVRDVRLYKGALTDAEIAALGQDGH